MRLVLEDREMSRVTTHLDTSDILVHHFTTSTNPPPGLHKLFKLCDGKLQCVQFTTPQDFMSSFSIIVKFLELDKQ